MTMDVTGDKLLVQQFVAGNMDAFVQLYNQYHPQICQFILKYVPAQPLAEDLTQEVFIKLLENRHLLEEVQSFRNYLFTAARNHTLNALKATSRAEAGLGLLLNSYAATRTHADDGLANAEYQAFLQRMLDQLPARTRDIFTRCREQGQTYDQVAAALGISRNAVKNHMVASLKFLSAAVKREFGLSIGLFFAIYGMQ